MTSPADVTSLKHEVAELWRRFRTGPLEAPADLDAQRQAVLEATRQLDEKHQALTARRDALDSARRLARSGSQARRLGLAALGVVAGALAGASLGALALEPLAVATTDLPPLAGALVLAATLPALALLRRDDGEK